MARETLGSGIHCIICLLQPNFMVTVGQHRPEKSGGLPHSTRGKVIPMIPALWVTLPFSTNLLNHWKIKRKTKVQKDFLSNRTHMTHFTWSYITSHIIFTATNSDWFPFLRANGPFPRTSELFGNRTQLHSDVNIVPRWFLRTAAPDKIFFCLSAYWSSGISSKVTNSKGLPHFYPVHKPLLHPNTTVSDTWPLIHLLQHSNNLRLSLCTLILSIYWKSMCRMG